MSRISFLDCPHPPASRQQYTEVCLDCGYNVYMTKEEYHAELRRRAEREGVDDTTLAIRALEKRLGIRGKRKKR